MITSCVSSVPALRSVLGSRMLSLVCLAASFSLLAAPAIWAQTDPATQQRRGPGSGSGSGSDTGPDKDGSDSKDKGGIKPYAEVITDKAKSDEGVFTVHRIDDKVFYEIPEQELGAEFLWVSRISKTPDGLGHGGQKLGSRVVRWDKQGDKILLREVSYGVVADPSLPIAQAVAASNTMTVLKAFPIKTFGGVVEATAGGERDVAAGQDGEDEGGNGKEQDGTDSADDDAAEAPRGTDPVIDVTALFTSEIAEFSARARIDAGGFASDRAYVERIASYPENIEVRASHTFTKPPASRSARGQAPPSRFRRSMAPGSATLEMAYSMVKLPENPMMPRLYDERVGYFSVRQVDFGRSEHRAQERRYITKWRLDKKNPSAAVSDPVQQIEYWIDPATPKKWIPYVKQGIEDWQPAFLEAGFSNAIVARDAPSPEEDPDWSPEDSRYSVVRWLASGIENASGPHVNDPRTGEILESDIQYYHNIQNLLRDWYFTQVAPLDPRAQKLPMPDDLMGELLRYVVAHEVGHTLGFQHNMKASSTVPFDKLRDPAFLKANSHTPTLMDYSRFNYVVQPEDGVDPMDLFPKVGRYDKWATKWGYAPIDGAQTSDAEVATLNAWANEQDDKPWLRFSTSGSGGSDPGELTEAVGDIDAVAATKLGVKNIKRVLDLILPATDWPGSDWDHVEELYGRVLGQWTREMNHVAAIVGGLDTRQTHRGQEGPRFAPISADRQREAVQYLLAEVFTTPDYFIREDILRRVEPSGVTDRIRGAQSSVLGSLLRDGRLNRMVEHEALDPSSAYRATDFLDDLRGGIFSELAGRRPEVEIFRRGAQQAFVDVVGSRLASITSGNDTRAFLRGQLIDLRGDVVQSLPRTQDAATRYHLEDLRDQIQRTLDPKIAPPSSGSGFGFNQSNQPEVDPYDPTADLGCWIDDSASLGPWR